MGVYTCGHHGIDEVALGALAHARVACCESCRNACTGQAACPPVIVTRLPGDSAAAASKNLADVPLLATSMLQRLPNRRLRHWHFRRIGVAGTYHAPAPAVDHNAAVGVASHCGWTRQQRVERCRLHEAHYSAAASK